MNHYITFDNLLDDIKKFVEEKDQEAKSRIQFLSDYTWATDEALEDLTTIMKEIRSNAAKYGLRKSAANIGRPANTEKIKEAVLMYKQGVRPVKVILKKTGIGKSTFYKNKDKYWDLV